MFFSILLPSSNADGYENYCNEVAKIQMENISKKVAIKLMSNLARKLRLQYVENTLFGLFCVRIFVMLFLKLLMNTNCYFENLHKPFTNEICHNIIDAMGILDAYKSHFYFRWYKSWKLTRKNHILFEITKFHKWLNNDTALYK